MHAHLIAVATTAGKTVPGESEAYFWAGVLTLAGVLVSVFAVSAAYQRKPYKWHLGFFSLILASSGTTLGLWKLAGDSGWRFFGASVLLAAGATLGARTWSIKWPIARLHEPEIDRGEDDHRVPPKT